MRTYLFILLSLLLLTAISAHAQTLEIGGQTRVHFTYEPIPFVYVLVMDKDSTVLASGMSSENEGLNPVQFHIKDIPWRETYIIKFSCLGYKTTCVPLTVKKKQTWIDMGSVLMKREPKLLGEAVVKATKIKMVVKKDTIIYDADAFQLSEGSMLDNLVRQLPGVELRDGGQITVNGRFVSSLLLNGKDFFKDSPNVMLENLPAYMVNKVKVYEKEQEDAYLMNDKTRAKMEKNLVMDVNLKREYSVGFLANAEGGYGSDDHYLGRLFGLRFTNNSRLSFFTNFNNLNQNQKPGSNGNWDKQWTPTGPTDLKSGGLDLYIDKKGGEYILNSNLLVQSEDVDQQTVSSGVLFLPDNDSYTFGRNNSLNKMFSLTSNHDLLVKKQGVYSRYTASFGYYHWNNRSVTQDAEFSEKPTETYRGQVLDTLFSPGRYTSLASALINSRQDKGLSRGNQFNASLYGKFSLGEWFGCITNGSFLKNKKKDYSQYGLDIHQNDTDFRNRYMDMFSEKYSYDIDLYTSYGLFDEKLQIGASHTFAVQHSSGDKSMYRLDRFEGWDSFDGHPLGYLPSTRDSLQQAMDWQNSYFSKETNLKHTPEIAFDYDLPSGENLASLSLSLPFNIAQDKLSYQRAELDTVVRRNKVLFTPKLTYYSQENNQKDKKRTEITYTFTPTSPQLTSMLDIRDDSDPLSIRLGNPDLKDEKIHRMKFSLTRTKQEKQRNLGLNVNWEARLDAIGQSMSYNEENGVRTFIPKNINGNWNAGINFNYSQAVGKDQHWQLSTVTDAKYINSVDWVSTTGTDNSIRSSVRNVNLSETLKADYRINEYYIGAKVGGKWMYATSERENFATISSVDMNYGVSAIVPLPWKFQLSTDLTLFSRRGYSISSMNTDETVWNATLSRSFLKGNLTCSLDGFDILGQLSNIRQTVNAQGRMETWYNCLPRYCMFRAIYRLNIQPKNRQ